MATRLLTLCLLAAASLCWGVPALAHVPSEPVSAAPLAVEPLESQVLSARGGPLVGLGTALAAAGLLAVAIARRRRAVALLSVAVLLVLAFETGLHSVHHIGEPDNSSCVVASASAQTAATTIAGIAFERPAEMPTPVAANLGNTVVTRLAAPDRGRAPPLT